MEFPGMLRILKTIETAKEKSGSGILVFYGEQGLGKTSLLLSLLNKYPYAKYYQAVPASSVQQALFMREALIGSKGLKRSEYTTYDAIFEKLSKDHHMDGRQVLIFDEFDYLLKADDTFMNSLIGLLSGAYGQREYLVILCTSSLGFVAGTMSKKMGRAALMIQGLLKMKEFGFEDMVNMSDKLSKTEVFYRYALMGGRPFPFQVSMKYESMRDIIIGMFLRRDGLFYDYGIKYISEQLREPGVYATILYLIANGNTKLNDLYALSGFSRAKISVYLKNLIELDLVEKVYSFGASPRDDSLKGVYRISNPMVNFWFRFLYENRSRLDVMDEETFFDKYIMNDLSEYLEFYYGLVASQLMTAGKVAAAADIRKCSEWVGKTGDIPVIGIPADGGGRKGSETVCAFMSRAKKIDADYIENCALILKKASLKPRTVIIFSEAGVEEGVEIKITHSNVLVTGILN